MEFIPVRVLRDLPADSVSSLRHSSSVLPNRVTDEFLNDATMPFDDPLHRAEVARHDDPNGFRVELFAEGRRADDVGEQDRYDLACVTDGSAVGREPCPTLEQNFAPSGRSEPHAGQADTPRILTSVSFTQPKLSSMVRDSVRANWLVNLSVSADGDDDHDTATEQRRAWIRPAGIGRRVLWLDKQE